MAPDKIDSDARARRCGRTRQRRRLNQDGAPSNRGVPSVKRFCCALPRIAGLVGIVAILTAPILAPEYATGGERRFFSARRSKTPPRARPASESESTLPPIDLKPLPNVPIQSPPQAPLTRPKSSPYIVPNVEPQPLPKSVLPSVPESTPQRVLRPGLQPAPAEPLLPRSMTSNVQVHVTDEFANRYLSSVRETAGPVNDCVLGARVLGDQITQSTVSLDFLPSARTALFDVVLQGTTDSRTSSSTPQATIDGTGRQQFNVRKSVEFDGTQFLTRSPGATLTSMQTNRQARTPSSPIPVIGSIADTIALMTADQYRPMAQLEGARRTTNRVAPEFNSNIDERLAKVNDALRKLRDASTTGMALRPDRFRCETTDHDLSIELQAGVIEPVAPAPAITPSGASLRLHEGALNAWLDSTEPGGREIAVSEIDGWLKTFREGLSLNATPVELESGSSTFDPASGATIILAEQDPVSVRFADQQFQIVLRASLRPMIGPELPDQEILISYLVRQEAERVLLEPRETTVTSRELVGNGIIVGEALDKIVRDQVQSRLQTLSIPTSVILPVPNAGARLTLKSLTLTDGWLAIDWQ